MNGTAPHVGWMVCSVGPAGTAEIVAAQLCDLANDPLTWSLSTLGATVIRHQVEGADRFYFSPPAVRIFAPLIETYAGRPCDPPRTRELARSKTWRMLLGFKTRWEPFQPPRIPARGIPAGTLGGEQRGGIKR